jgi:hypothetical protein
MMEKLNEITEAEFWSAMELPPILRLGWRDGPGGVFHDEPYSHRICSIAMAKATTHDANFVLKDEMGVSRFYAVVDPLTLEEFKALCAVVIPGVGVCAMGYGRNLVSHAAPTT